MKISAKINTMQNINICFLLVHVLKKLEALQLSMGIWTDFRQDIIDTAIYQWRKRLQACVRANGGHYDFEHVL